MKPKKIILAMSGGVDSSVAALLLKKQGYEVHGFFMNCNLFGKSKLPSKIDWQTDEKILKKICKKLNIALHTFDCELGYTKKVIQPMINDYKKGLTPNPDTLCNKVGKFPKMLALAKELNADHIATGHYARVKKTKSGFSLLRGKDKTKDQSYFLCKLNQKILSKTLFPLGNLTKSEVRKIAKKNKFQNWDKRGSRSICYLGKIDLKAFLRKHIPQHTGNLLSPENEVMGTHPGAAYFTIGETIKEKTGFVINKKFRKQHAGQKLYIAKKLSNNEIQIAPKDHPLLKTKKVFLKSFKQINPKEKLPNKDLKSRIRHLGALYSGKLKKENRRYTFTFNKAQEGVAPGQHLALYKKETLVARGEIRLKLR